MLDEQSRKYPEIDLSPLLAFEKELEGERIINSQVLKTALDYNDDAVLISGIDGTILYSNGHLESWLGITKEELFKLGWHEITPEEDLVTDEEALSRILEDGLKGYVLFKRYKYHNRELFTRLKVIKVDAYVGTEYFFAYIRRFPCSTTHCLERLQHWKTKVERYL